MATQAKAMDLLRVDYDKLQVEVSRLRVEKEALEKQVASGDAAIFRNWRRRKSPLSRRWRVPSRRGSKRP